MKGLTKEEISLCKQVAKKHMKKIKYGDWFEFKGNILLQKSMHHPEMSERCTPLWTISDCLEFLEERGYDKILSFMYFPKDRWVFVAESFIVETPYKKVRREGKTKLEACLKSVLAVLGEGK